MSGQTEQNIILAIETAVQGGSLSLIENGREIDHWTGQEGVSRSEDLLLSISDILAKNYIDRSRIESIAVSTGPGSYTGTRVGMATALGLKNALNIPCKGIQVLWAMNISKATGHGDVVSAIPIGRDDICWQSFTSSGADELMVGKEDGFFDFLRSHNQALAVLHEKIFGSIKDMDGVDPLRFENAGVSLARHVGVAALYTKDGSGMTPTYARDFI